jgi:glycosyltransferase involved in cell wall biosynthesis
MKRTISVISPCYNEELNVRSCHEAIKDLFATRLAAYKREHIFADNASSDKTVSILREIAAGDPCTKIIINARNVGPLRSAFNALKACTGDAIVVMMAVDLQDPPELIASFVERWESGDLVVHGLKVDREEGALMRAIRRIYYRVVRLLADIDMPVNVSEFQLIDRRVRDAIIDIEDHNPYLRGLIAATGFKASSVPYIWRARERGTSKHRFGHLLDIGLNGVLSFSKTPVRLLTSFGLLLAVASLLYAFINFIWLLILLPSHTVPPGIPSLIVALFFFAGIQFLFLGILGEYIVSIHHQVRFGGRVVERERINFDPPESPKRT